MPIQVSESADYQELVRLQELQRTAHFTRNAELLVSIFADDFQVVQDGQIAQPSRAESLARFQSYFARSTFVAWDDLQTPLISIAADGSLATVIVQKRVQIHQADATEPAHEEQAVFAWLESYEKRGGRWLLTTIVSTRAPGG